MDWSINTLWKSALVQTMILAPVLRLVMHLYAIGLTPNWEFFVGLVIFIGGMSWITWYLPGMGKEAYESQFNESRRRA